MMWLIAIALLLLCAHDSYAQCTGSTTNIASPASLYTAGTSCNTCPKSTSFACSSCTAGNTCASGGCCLVGATGTGQNSGSRPQTNFGSCTTNLPSTNIVDASTCSMCPTCCRVKNPSFNKQCSVNIALILDNTLSLCPYCGTVRPAVGNFIQSFNSLLNVGASAQLGVIVFQQVPTVVWDMTPVSSSYLTNIYNWVMGTTSCVTGVWPSGIRVPSFCTRMGTTNWAAALVQAANFTWRSSVDIYVWFTDGYPEYSSLNVPQTGCSAQCYDARSSNKFFQDICANSQGVYNCPYGNGAVGLSGMTEDLDAYQGLWTSCTAADFLKARGAKLFLVGVGLVNKRENMIQLVTGKNAWDGKPSTFASADYYISSDYNALSNLLAATVQGLCSCLQVQPNCAAASDASTSCNARSFNAWVRVTTTVNSTSTTFPANSVTSGYVYYNFAPSPDTRIAYSFFLPGTAVNASNPSVIRTDVQNPCSVTRQVSCGNGCYQISERQLIPRLFHESGDVAGTSGCVNSAPAGCTGYTKQYPSPPYGSLVPEMIECIWVLTANRSTPCAAEAFDGTFYEFFRAVSPLQSGVLNMGGTPLRLPSNTAAFNFTANSSCTSPTCGTSVELVFVIDEQTTLSSADWTNIQNFVLQIIGSFNLSDPKTRFGIVWTNPSAPGSSGTALQSTTLQGWQTVIQGHAQGAGSSDFAARVTFALNKFWPGPSTNGVPRQLLTIVGGPDSGTTANRYSTLQSLFQSLGVEHWAIGVDEGSSQTSLLTNLASTNNYVHYISVFSSTFLASQVPLQAQLLCPQTSLCGSSCAGFCACNTPGSCSCPTCASTTCQPMSCSSTSPQLGCTGSPIVCNDNSLCTSETCINPQGCVFTSNASNCVSNDICQNPVCVNSTGCGLVPKSQSVIAVLCNDSNPCTQDTCVNNKCVNSPISCGTSNRCTQYFCVNATGQCSFNTTSCSDGDICTSDSCDPVTGCVFTPLNSSNINAVCPPTGSCRSPQCVVGSNRCTYTNDTSAACACTNYPCTNNTFCTTPVCINSASGCASLPANLVATCNSFVNGTFGIPFRYCYDQPKTNVCPTSDSCTRYTCTNGAGTSGSCVQSNTTCTSNDKCQNPICYPATGCGLTPKNASVIASLCGASNPCWTVGCSNNSCTTTQAKTCPPNDRCTQYTCNNVTGNCDVTTTVCSDGDICTVDSCNATTGCVYTPLSTTQLLSTCNPPSCRVAQCVVGSNRCTYTNDTTVACSCTNYPCTNNTFCSNPVCINTVSGCSSLPSNLNATCNSFVNGTFGIPLRYCYDQPKTNVCPTSDSCTRYTCTNGAGTSGSCVQSNTTCTSNDKCQNPICYPATGCGLTPKNASVIASLCGTSNACWTFGCSNNSCTTTQAKTCPPSDRCTQYTCNNVTGNCDNTTTVCNDGDVCTVDSCNPTTGCSYRSLTAAELLTTCNPPSCRVAQCVVGSNRCTYTNDTTVACSCTNYPCTNNTFCSNPVCINTASGCSSLPSNLNATCNSFVNGTFGIPLRYCYDQPKTNVCPTSDSCTRYTCVNGAGTSGSCVQSNTTCTSNDKCQNPICYPATGCGLTPKNASVIASLCGTSNACWTFGCSNNSCTTTQAKTCPPSDRCTQYTCNNVTGNCDVTTTVCSDGDICTVDSCNATTGCVYTPLSTTQLLSTCNPPSCRVAQCVVGSNQCTYTNDTTVACSCTNYPCTNNTFCSTPVCINTVSGCSSLPSNLNATCNSFVNGTFGIPLRYCYDQPKTNVCPTSDACTQYTCTNGAGTSGSCVQRNTTCTSNDICQNPICYPATGCGLTPKNASVIASLCGTSNACWTFGCSNNACTTTQAKTCPPSDRCTQYTCNNVTGNCDVTTTVCSDGDICTVDSCNATTGCVYTPLSTSAQLSLCNPGSCQNATCTVGSNRCTYVNITTGVCSSDACVATPCTNQNTFCTRAVCINTLTSSSGWSCASITNATLQAQCQTNITNGPIKRFCYDAPASPCPASDACTSYTCVNGAGTSGSCVQSNTTCTSNDICQNPICYPATGCGLTPKNASVIASLCGTSNACWTFGCSNNSCTTTQAKTCPPSDRCTQYTCNNVTGNCDVTTTVCSDGDICTVDSCNATTGCVYTPLSTTQLLSTCNPPSCRVAQCVVGSNQCTYTNDTTVACSCTNYPCTNNTFCWTPVCINTVSGCSSLPSNLNATCNSFVNGTFGIPLRYCYDQPKTNVCPTSDACTQYTCTNGAGTSGSCVQSNTTCTSNDICQNPICYPATGCGLTPKNASVIASLCGTSNACWTFGCSNNSCTTTQAKTCPPSDRCTQYTCNNVTGNCDVTTTVCSDGDICTVDSCNATTGCVYTPLSTTQLLSTCNPPSCRVAQCVVGSNQCTYTNDTTVACSCTNYPCTNNTFCSTPVCINTVSGCSSLPSNLNATCNSFVNGTFGIPLRYCYDQPKTNVCPTSDACTQYTCTNGAGTSGSCVQRNTTCTSNDICQNPICYPATGCGLTPKNASVIASLCGTSNACWTFGCSNNSCTTTQAKTCPTSDRCTQYTCNNVTGNCDVTTTVCSDGDICTVDSCNATTGCVYTPLSTTQLLSTCNPPSCRVAQCVVGSNQCTYTNDTTVACSCTNYPCTNNTFCSTPVCINTVSGCSSLPSNLNATCNSFVNGTFGIPLRYCYDQPKTNVCPTSDACTQYTCTNGAGTSGSCVQRNTTCTSNDMCQNPICYPATGCGLTPKNASVIASLCGTSNACWTFGCSNNSCTTTQAKTCPPSDRCTQYTCNNVTGNCDVTTTVCSDGDICTVDSCNATTGCVYTPLSAAELSTSCVAPNCQVAQCVVGSNRCTYSNDTSAACACTNYPCTNNTFCSSPVCINSGLGCSSLPAGLIDVCNSYVNGTRGVPLRYCYDQPKTNVCPTSDLCTQYACRNGVGTSGSCAQTNTTCVSGDKCVDVSCAPSDGCVYLPKKPDVIAVLCDDRNACTEDTCFNNSCVHVQTVQCPPTTACVQYRCDANSGVCIFNSTNCDDNNACTVDSCDDVTGCKHLPYVCPQLTPCFAYVCSGTQPNGQPNCTQGAATVCDDGSSCTTDECELKFGCVYTNVTCAPTTECNFPVGCVGTGPAPECLLQNITSLIDFCGVCRGDDASCFFSSVISSAAVGGIAAGAVAGIVVACIIAALIALWLGRKGWQYYQAQSDLSSASMNNNPYFQENQLSGEIPTSRGGTIRGAGGAK